MARANIIIRTTCKGYGVQECVGGYLIEEIVKGKANRCEGFLYRESMSAVEITLQLLINALTIIKRSENEYESVTIFTDVPLINSAFEHKWFEKWHDQEWMNAKGEKVAHVETWQKLWKILYSLTDKWCIDETYSMWGNQLKLDCEKELKSKKSE